MATYFLFYITLNKYMTYAMNLTDGKLSSSVNEV